MRTLTGEVDAYGLAGLIIYALSATLVVGTCWWWLR